MGVAQSRMRVVPDCFGMAGRKRECQRKKMSGCGAQNAFRDLRNGVKHSIASRTEGATVQMCGNSNVAAEGSM